MSKLDLNVKRVNYFDIQPHFQYIDKAKNKVSLSDCCKKITGKPMDKRHGPMDNSLRT